MTRAFLLDLSACTGCSACRLACTIENRLEWGTSWRTVTTFNPSRHPAAPRFHLSLACNHCERAPCLEQCPALAIRREPATGAVLIDPGRCMGCGYCSWVCPWDAPRLDEREGVMTKCTLCSERLERGRGPACAELCPTGALRCGELEELAGAAEVEGFLAPDVGPSIRFLPLSEGRRGPIADAGPAEPLPSQPAPRRGLSLASEWPLLAFTLSTAVLVGWLGAAAIAGTRPDPLAFLGVAASGLVLGSLHLGRKARAWRALLGARRSRLSREIAACSTFALLAAAHLLLAPSSAALAWTAVLVGLAGLFFIDRVYDPALPRSRAPVHSADTLPTALLFMGALSVEVWIAAPVALIRLGLYAWRKAGLARPAWSALRVGVGMLAPAALWALQPLHWREWMVAALVAGELVDRCELYLELELATPRAQAAADLERRLRDQEAAGAPPAQDPGLRFPA